MSGLLSVIIEDFYKSFNFLKNNEINLERLKSNIIYNQKRMERL